MTNRYGTLLIVVLLACSSCGGPDYSATLANSQASATKAAALVAAGHWSEAATEWTAARTLLEPYASAKQGDRTLGDFLTDERTSVFAAVTAHAPALLETGVTDRASLAVADDLMAISPTSDLTKHWVETDRPALLARMMSAENARRIAAAEAERTRLAHSFVVWTESFGCDVDAKDLKDLTAAMAKTLAEKVAPLTVVIVDKPPGRPIGGASARLELNWHCVTYVSGQFQIPMGKPVPDQLEANLIIASRFCTTNLDAGCRWTFTRAAPAQIGMGGSGDLVRKNTAALLSDLTAAFPALPALKDADAVGMAFDKGAHSVRGLWTWTATSHAANADKRMTMFGGYADYGGAVIAAIQRRCPDVDLVQAGSTTEPSQGTITLSFTVQEVSFGKTQNRSLQTENGALPISMMVSATIMPASGACSWGANKSWHAAAAPPEKVAQSELPAMASRLGDQLVETIARQIAQEPELTAK